MAPTDQLENMAQNEGCLNTAISMIVKWSRFLLPCIPESEDEDLPEVNIELTPEIVNKLYSVLENDLTAMFHHVRHVIVHRSANYEFGFFNEPTGVIDGKGLTAWLMINLEIAEMEEAQFIANLLNGHETLFTIVNHYMIVARVGHFRRYPTPNNRFDGKTASNDLLFACYLCEKFGTDWKNLVFDLSQWVFVYVPPVDDQLHTEDPRAVTPWVPSLWAGPLMNKPRIANIRACLAPNNKLHRK